MVKLSVVAPVVVIFAVPDFAKLLPDTKKMGRQVKYGRSTDSLDGLLAQLTQQQAIFFLQLLQKNFSKSHQHHMTERSRSVTSVKWGDAKQAACGKLSVKMATPFSRSYHNGKISFMNQKNFFAPGHKRGYFCCKVALIKASMGIDSLAAASSGHLRNCSI